MAKVVLPYSCGNNLAEFIANERAKRNANSETNILLSEIEQELANYCFITIDGIKAIKKLNSSPSLPVALRIAKFFNVIVTDIFPLIDEDSNEEAKEVPQTNQKKLYTVKKQDKI